MSHYFSIVEYAPDHTKKPSVYDREVVMFIRYDNNGTDDPTEAFTCPARVVWHKPKNHPENVFYVNTDRIKKNLAFADAFLDLMRSFSDLKNTKVFNPPKTSIRYVPLGNWYEVDLSTVQQTSVRDLGENIQNIPLDVCDKIWAIMGEIHERKMPIDERIRRYLTESEIAASRHKIWTKRKKNVLGVLLEKFAVPDVAEYFGVSEDTIVSISTHFA